jgi:hypothetical protein
MPALKPGCGCCWGGGVGLAVSSVEGRTDETERGGNSSGPGVDGGRHPRPWHGPWVGELRPLGTRLPLVENAAKLSGRSLGQLRGGLRHSLGQLGGMLLLLWCGGWLNWLLCDGTGNRRQVSEAGIAPAAFRL